MPETRPSGASSGTRTPAVRLFRRVVCALGDEPGELTALRQVERLRPVEGELVAVVTCETTHAVRAGMQAPAVLAELREAARETLDAALAAVPEARGRIVEGRPAGALLRVLVEEGATLVALESEHARAVGIALEAPATTMLHDAPCSVLVARAVPDLGAFPASILVGVDGSRESLAAAAVAADLARRLDVPLRAVAATGGKSLDEEALAESGLELEWDERKPLDALLAASGPGDLLVVGSRGLHGLRALGSVSERIAHRAPCPVLVVREPAPREPVPAASAGMRVRDVMTSPVVTAPEDTPVAELARLMVEQGTGSVVVTDGEGGPAGIVTETDLAVSDRPLPFTLPRLPRTLGRYVWSEESLEEAFAEARSRPAGEVMSAPLVTIGPDEPVWHAVAAMLTREIKRVPVVEDARLVGIVTQHDLLKCLLADGAGGPTPDR
jgi:CBS domain-containing protein